MDRCSQCGFDYGTLAPVDVPAALASVGESFRAGLLDTPDEALRRRPKPDVWSGLEYACHVRDVLLVQRDRLYLALVEDKPGFPRMHRDERAALARYNLQEPHAVADQIQVASQLISAAFAAVEEVHWRRRLIYNWPDAQERDVLWLGAHTVHEGRHHLADFDAAISGRVPGDA
jgi:S-DNA-T family DNA segregation ATPase FtsK/SpoIIIE